MSRSLEDDSMLEGWAGQPRGENPAAQPPYQRTPCHIVLPVNTVASVRSVLVGVSLQVSACRIQERQREGLTLAVPPPVGEHNSSVPQHRIPHAHDTSSGGANLG